LDIILDISKLKNRSVTLNEFSADGRNIIIKGTALSFENVDEFKNKLMPLFTDVKVLDSKTSADKSITFSIIAREIIL
ncbi:MAG: PilN domain-containing protein, partial [Nitrospirae bacterium]|nr:PilN domain-containing protein [Nitrospirota bacterium]